MKRQGIILAVGLLFSVSGTSCQALSSSSPISEPKGDPVGSEVGFEARSLAIRQKLAADNLEELDRWWRRVKLGDPHKYLLPVILARLSLEGTAEGQRYNREETWEVLRRLNQDQPDLYHFRAPLDVRIFFSFRDTLPAPLTDSYRQQLATPWVLEWSERGTENHMMMQRMSGLALMDGSGFPVGDPATAATNEAWLRSELNKFLTIGQGEFHSSTYYGYSISGLLNLYDFARHPALKDLAKATLDWYATNMALRLSWGTAGGAESRGFDRGTWDSGLTAVAWMWWGDQLKAAESMHKSSAWLALPVALSSYRPPPHLHALAHKQVPLPFEARMSHPAYYSYDQDNYFHETFYVTEDYSLGTLLEPRRTYQVKGTIQAQYATYKLVVRDRDGNQNGVINLGGTYHGAGATGRSPGDQLVQKRGAVIFGLILNAEDLDAGVPARSHLVIPQEYGEPQRYQQWYIWRVENTWFCTRPWGDQIQWQPLNDPNLDRQGLSFNLLAATGTKTAWITDVARVSDYPTWSALISGLEKTTVDDRQWESDQELTYHSLAGDQIRFRYQPGAARAEAWINGEKQVLNGWPVIESPLVQAPLSEGSLTVQDPQLGQWQLKATLRGPTWKIQR